MATTNEIAVGSPKAAKKIGGVAKKSAATKKTTPPKNHPTYLQMIVKAIEELKEKKGASRQAIVKYLLSHYTLGGPNDTTKILVRINMALRKGAEVGGVLVQVNGSRFRLADKKGGAAKPKKAVAKKTNVPAKVVEKAPQAAAEEGEGTAPKPKKVMKTAALPAKKKAAPKKAAAGAKGVAEKKKVVKEKKSVKTPTKKPKVVKPAAPKGGEKKAAPKPALAKKVAPAAKKAPQAKKVVAAKGKKAAA